ncbi:hypothetical protein MVEN_01160700 [Mycena venus]|uniref:Uncharacterized protein n=1 Tax=Mycena venus TaxID=2733690 RepID=A0A8H7CVM4_9AGAR|nr:hypothetical protein MVEN_01160700 [Mycena venus]
MPNPVDDSPNPHGAIALPPDASELQLNDAATRRSKFRRRIIYFLLICSTLSLAGRAIDRRPGAVDIARDPRLQAYQTPGSAQYCAEWTSGGPLANGSHLAHTSFELPTTADLLFFLSRGGVSGHIDIIKARASPRIVQVNVTAQYHKPEDLERTKACRIGHANEHGVLIWAGPRHPHDPTHDSVRVSITVAIPSSTGVTSYKDLSTDLPLFSHTLDNFFMLFFPWTVFEHIRLRASSADIQYGSLIARAAFIETSYGKVEGLFSGYELKVHTSNSPIDSVALMLAEGAGSEARVELKTSNGKIKSSIRFLPSPEFPDNVVLRAVVKTSGAPLAISAPAQLMAYNTSFFLDASTSGAPASVSLSHQYEGTYDLRTSLGAHVYIEEGEKGGQRPGRQGKESNRQWEE